MNREIERLALDKVSAIYNTKSADFARVYSSRHLPSFLDDTSTLRYNLTVALRALKELRIYRHVLDAVCDNAKK